jgi:hypothetical protein
MLKEAVALHANDPICTQDSSQAACVFALEREWVSSAQVGRTCIGGDGGGGGVVNGADVGTMCAGVGHEHSF